MVAADAAAVVCTLTVSVVTRRPAKAASWQCRTVSEDGPRRKSVRGQRRNVAQSQPKDLAGLSDQGFYGGRYRSRTDDLYGVNEIHAVRKTTNRTSGPLSTTAGIAESSTVAAKRLMSVSRDRASEPQHEHRADRTRVACYGLAASIRGTEFAAV